MKKQFSVILVIVFMHVGMYSQNCNPVLNLADTVQLAPIVGYTPTASVTVNGQYKLFDTTWTPSAGVSNPNILNPNFLASGNYILILLSKDTTNIVLNGDFSSGNVGFTTQYLIGTGGTWGPVSNPGTYLVTTNPILAHTNFVSIGDHTTGTGNMLVVNGSGTPNTNVWCQTVPVNTNTDYYFDLWATSVVNSSPGILTLKINNSSIMPNYTLSTTTGLWQNIFSTWNSGTNTSANICISNQNTTNSGNDFAIDDISFRQICVTTDSMYVLPQLNFTNTKTTHCFKDTFNFTATNYFAFDSLVWNFGDGSKSYGPTTSHYYAINGNYSVTLTKYLNNVATTVSKTIFYGQILNVPSLNGSVKHVKCHGGDNGSISINVGNTTFPVSVNINGGIYQQNVFAFNNLTAGVYTVHVMNQDGCDNTAIFTISQPSKLVLQPTVKDITCAGKNDGKVTLFVSGGISPYTYQSVQINSPLVINNQFPGTRKFRIYDANGCNKDTTLTIEEPQPLSLNAFNIVNSKCFVSDFGSFDVSAIGGNSPYTYYYNGVSNGNDTHFGSVPNGNYVVKVIDKNNCEHQIDVGIVDLCCQPLIPNAFSPDGNNLNDNFFVQNHNDFNFIKMRIFNRFGQQIFDGINQDAVWDGTSNGRIVDIGAYIYIIEVNCDSYNKTKVFTGEVTLMK